MEELNYVLIDDASEVAAACERLSRHAELGFDTETTSLSPFDGRLRLVQLAAPGEPVYVFDLFKLAPNGDTVNEPALEPLRRLLFAARPVKVAHNCLAGDMLVSMSDGTKIRIDKLVRERAGGEVLCVDEETGAIRTGTIVDWVDGGIRPWDDWLRIRMRGKGRLRVTKDHEILTERGRVRAESLLVGDKVLTSLPALSQPQRDMLYGSLLGDGSLMMQRSAQARTPYFKVSHSTKQEGYVALKAAALGDLVKLVKTENVNYRGFSDNANGTQLIVLTTKSDPRLFDLYDDCLTGGKRTLTRRWLDNLSVPAMAVWYCDDGSLSKTSVRICVSALGRQGADTLVEFLRSREFPARLWVRPDGQLYVKVAGPYGRGMSSEMRHFWEGIAPYVPTSMRYKLPEAYAHLASDEYWTTGQARPGAFSDTVVEISPLLNDSVERRRYDGYRRGKRRGIRQYCLTVSTHRNFVAGGLAVSNCKFDAKWVRHHLGVELCGEFDSRAENKKEVERGGLFDTLLASQLISAGEQEDRHSLASVAERYLNQAVDKSQQVSDWGGELSAAQLEYAARDAALMLPLRLKLVDALRAAALTRTAQLEFECVVPLAALELAGVYLDQPCWRAKLKDIGRQRGELHELLQDELSEEPAQQSLFGPVRADINLDSHVQLTRALKRVLPAGEEIPDSTRNWKLEPLALKFPVVRQILDYRTLQKTLKFGETLLEAVNPKTGRIHSNFHQIGAPTGRMSSTDPNVQQIPHAFDMRRCFRAPEGRKLIDADYCVAAGTRVATARGLVPVERVVPGDEVYLEDGSTAGVSATVKRGTLPTVTVTLKNGYSLTATTLHRVRVLDEEGEYVWRRIGELKKSDRVVIQPGRGLNERLPYVGLPAALSEHHNNHKTLTTPQHADERLATFMGYVAGDGSLRKRGIEWVVNDSDADVSDEVRGLASELFGIPVHDRGAYRGVREEGLYSSPLLKWLTTVGLSKDSVPDFLWASRPSVVTAYLRGLFESDGSVTDSDTGKVSFASSRRRIAAEVHMLLLALGVPATLREQRNTGPDKRFNCWTVSVVAAGLRTFSERVGFMSRRKREKLQALLLRQTGKTVVGNMPNLSRRIRSLRLSGEARRLLNNSSSLGRPVSTALAAIIENAFPEVAHSLGLQRVTKFKQLFLPVSKIEPAGEREVFDLSVPGPMAYISDGFVSHNSQIELRILADFTGDRGFVDAFTAGVDLHRATAAQVFNVKKIEDVTKEQRDFAKRLNFGVVYGIGARRFALLTGLKESEAEDLLRRYFATYRELDSWLRDAGNKAVRERTAPRTVAGRLFRFNFDPEDRQAASLAHRGGKNSPIQGSSADIIKRAMRLLHDRLKGTGAAIVNVVHDEIVVETGAGEAEETAKVVEGAMCDAGEEYVKAVPVKVEASVTDEWVK
jgi:DNA polymerase I-like protein with 3'-5' exonuclease and polymerase domains/intein/homing endonuclease